jgi:hypothetical protein
VFIARSAAVTARVIESGACAFRELQEEQGIGAGRFAR